MNKLEKNRRKLNEVKQNKYFILHINYLSMELNKIVITPNLKGRNIMISDKVIFEVCKTIYVTKFHNFLGLNYRKNDLHIH